jgi:hypothetical protein
MKRGLRRVYLPVPGELETGGRGGNVQKHVRLDLNSARKSIKRSVESCTIRSEQRAQEGSGPLTRIIFPYYQLQHAPPLIIGNCPFMI